MSRVCPKAIPSLLPTNGDLFECRLRFVLAKGIENVGTLWIDTGESWAARSSWDSNISGEAAVCVYNASDLFDNACSEVRENSAPAPHPTYSIRNTVKHIRRCCQQPVSTTASTSLGVFVVGLFTLDFRFAG